MATETDHLLVVLLQLQTSLDILLMWTKLAILFTSIMALFSLIMPLQVGKLLHE